MHLYSCTKLHVIENWLLVAIEYTYMVYLYTALIKATETGNAEVRGLDVHGYGIDVY